MYSLRFQSCSLEYRYSIPSTLEAEPAISPPPQVDRKRPRTTSHRHSQAKSAAIIIREYLVYSTPAGKSK